MLYMEHDIVSARTSFKNCYLKLKALYESHSPTAVKMRKYAEILELYENQSDSDYDDMIFDAYMRGQTLDNAIGADNYILDYFSQRRDAASCKTLFLSALFLMPVAFCAFWVRPL